MIYAGKEMVEYVYHTVSLNADSVLWWNHFAPWKVLKERPKLQLRFYLTNKNSLLTCDRGEYKREMISAVCSACIQCTLYYKGSFLKALYHWRNLFRKPETLEVFMKFTFFPFKGIGVSICVQATYDLCSRCSTVLCGWMYWLLIEFTSLRAVTTCVHY